MNSLILILCLLYYCFCNVKAFDDMYIKDIRDNSDSKLIPGVIYSIDVKDYPYCSYGLEYHLKDHIPGNLDWSLERGINGTFVLRRPDLSIENITIYRLNSVENFYLLLSNGELVYSKINKNTCEWSTKMYSPIRGSAIDKYTDHFPYPYSCCYRIELSEKYQFTNGSIEIDWEDTDGLNKLKDKEFSKLVMSREYFKNNSPATIRKKYSVKHTFTDTLSMELTKQTKTSLIIERESKTQTLLKYSEINREIYKNVSKKIGGSFSFFGFNFGADKFSTESTEKDFIEKNKTSISRTTEYSVEMEIEVPPNSVIEAKSYLYYYNGLEIKFKVLYTVDVKGPVVKPNMNEERNWIENKVIDTNTLRKILKIKGEKDGVIAEGIISGTFAINTDFEANSESCLKANTLMICFLLFVFFFYI